MKQKQIWSILDVATIVLLAAVPLFLKFPYRVGTYLSWEGAYRISQGEIPFRDFGMPMGGLYWVIPAIFFKLFGPYVISLIKAQVFINILGGLAFRSILKSFNVLPPIRLSAILVFCLAYSFRNYWPWYNHTVIVFSLITLAFLMKAIFAQKAKMIQVNLALAGLFTYISFFTKQDGGGMVFFICLFILFYYCWLEKKWKNILFYIVPFALATTLTVLFFSQYEFQYWFNYGQLPHNPRLDKADIIKLFLNGSEWIKLYLFLIGVIAFWKFRDWRTTLVDKSFMVSLLLTLGILCFAAIYQITSYTPEDGNVFFHAFAYAFIITNLVQALKIGSSNLKLGLLLVSGVMLWWSHIYWLYISRIFFKSENKAQHTTSATGENVVNMHNAVMYKKDTTRIDIGKWVYTELPSLKNISVPPPTAEGIHRLMKMDVVRNTANIKVLNMSELTSLAKDIPYEMEKGPDFPLWYHLGVGMFNRDAEKFEKKIRENFYDLVLFEDLPELNHFYPYRVQKVLKEHYQMVDRFLAPRSTAQGFIEVYVKKQPE